MQAKASAKHVTALPGERSLEAPHGTVPDCDDLASGPETKGHQWTTGGRLTTYQVTRTDAPELILETRETFGPASLRPGPDHRASRERGGSEVTGLPADQI